MKKFLTVLLCVCLLLTCFVGCDTNETVQEGGLKIGLITDIGGFGDKGYNDYSLEGLKKAKEDFKIDYIAVESKEVSDYIINLETLSESGCQMIITTGAAFSEAVSIVAPKYPEVHYVVLEATIEGIKNVTSTISKEHEGGFLLGYLAASITKTNEIGFISAISGPAFERFEVGYKSGAMTFNKDIKILKTTIGNFTDVNKGKETANMMFKQGADFIATCAGGVNQGVFQAAKENNKFCFGAATGQFDQAPENIIASQVKLVDNQVYTLAAELSKGNYPESGLFRSGLKEGLVDLLYNPNPTTEMSALLTEEIKSTIKQLKEDIINGKIAVPSTFNEFDTYILTLK